MPTLVEKLREFDGEVGEYEWTVEVWRADTTAVCNLRVVLYVYRRKDRSRWLPSGRKQVHRESEVARESGVEEDAQDMVARGQSLAERFDSERETVEEVSVGGA